MKTITAALIIVVWILPCPVVLGEPAGTVKRLLDYNGDGRLNRPEHYREWVFLTSGFDMSYATGMQMDHHLFDNVFVDPDAYGAFVASGTWPDKTVLVIENRAAQSKGSINRSGNYQGARIEGLEVHVKDAARFPGKWAFFVFDDSGPAKMIPRSEACYSCHAAHAAVDTTFVQFYPTLLPIAQGNGTLSAGYRKDLAAAEGK